MWNTFQQPVHVHISVNFDSINHQNCVNFDGSQAAQALNPAAAQDSELNSDSCTNPHTG